jgi:hypothetical protein
MHTEIDEEISSKRPIWKTEVDKRMILRRI